MLEALGAQKEEIPFVGELVRVREDEKEWESAIEKVLHNFALRLVVPAKYYSKVNQYVNNNDLRGRVRYDKYEDQDDLKNFRTGSDSDKSLFGKLEHELLLKVFIYGLIADTILVQLGWIRFESDYPFAAISPVWMWALWLVFATTLKESMAWLQGKNGLAGVLGAIAGPLCYEAGVRLGAASWSSSEDRVFALI